jgi:hypothetical protein
VTDGWQDPFPDIWIQCSKGLTFGNMSRKRKSEAKEGSWSVYKIAGKPKLLGYVTAPSEQAALAQAFETLPIREEDRFRVAVRQGW